MEPLMKSFQYRFLRSYDSCKLKLKLGTHMDNVYQNQGQGHITLGVSSLDRFCNLPLMKIFVPLFSRTVRVTKLKPVTHMFSRLMYRVYGNQGQGPMTHGFKSLQQTFRSGDSRLSPDQKVCWQPAVLSSNNTVWNDFLSYLWNKKMLPTLFQRYDKKSFLFWPTW